MESQNSEGKLPYKKS